jgi:WD40 repeat protein
VRTGQSLGALAAVDAGNQATAFAPNGLTVVSAGNDGILRLWDRSGRIGPRFYYGHTDRVWSIAFAPDGRSLATASRDRSVRLWDTSNPSGRSLLEGPPGSTKIAFTPDGASLVACNLKGDFRIFHVADATLRIQRNILPDGTQDPTYVMPDGLILVDAGPEAVSTRYDPWTGRAVDTLFLGLKGLVLAELPRGPFLLRESGSDDEPLTSLTVMTPRGERFVLRAQGEKATFQTPMFSGDGLTLALVVQTRGELYLESVDLASHESRRAHRPFRGAGIWGLAISPDGSMLAACGRAGFLELWDLSTLEPRAVLSGHSHDVSALAFSPDGRLLASGGWDRVVRLWDVSTGRELYRLEGHSGSIGPLSFSPDGLTLASSGEAAVGGGPSELILWRGDPPESSKKQATDGPRSAP